MTKTCFKCQVEKSVEEFPWANIKGNRRGAWCKPCRKAYHQEWYARNRAIVLEKQRARQSTKAGRALSNERTKRWRRRLVARGINPSLRTPEDFPMTAAHYMVRAAIRCQLLPRANAQSCKDCGGTAQHYDHHLGYAQEHWLDVEAVCAVCHSKRTRTRAGAY